SVSHPAAQGSTDGALRHPAAGRPITIGFATEPEGGWAGTPDSAILRPASTDRDRHAVFVSRVAAAAAPTPRFGESPDIDRRPPRFPRAARLRGLRQRAQRPRGPHRL